MADVNVAAIIPLADMRAIILSWPDIQNIGITDIALSGNEQVLDASVAVDRIVGGKIIPDNRPALKALFDRVHPHVAGRISFGLAVESASEAPTKDQVSALVFRLLPIFRSMKIEKVTFDAALRRARTFQGIM